MKYLMFIHLKGDFSFEMMFTGPQNFGSIKNTFKIMEKHNLFQKENFKAWMDVTQF